MTNVRLTGLLTESGDVTTVRSRRPKNLYQLAVLLEWSEIRMRGAMGLLEPLFRLLAKRTQNKGIDKELEAKYCR
jgi:hypothetical protein